MAFNTWEEQALGLLAHLPLCGAAQGRLLSVGTCRPVGKNVCLEMLSDGIIITGCSELRVGCINTKS